MSITPTFAGEMQLAGWSESHTGGCKVTFWLQSPDDLAAFRTLTTRKGNTAGHRFMAALVEVGDDEMPVVHAMLAKDPGDVPETDCGNIEKPKMGPLAYWLVLRCNEPEFWGWLRTRGHDCRDAKAAGDIVKNMLGLQSRKDLDGNPDCVEIFHGYVRGPYSKFLAARGVFK